MKHFTLIVIFSIGYFGQTKANKIDSLKTSRDVENSIAVLFKKKYDARYYKFSLAKPDSIKEYYICDSTITWESNRWQKTDFNKDGLTDLFAIVYEVDTINSHFPRYAAYVVIDQKNDHYQLNDIPGYLIFNCYAVQSILVNNYSCLLYRHYRTDYRYDSIPGTDTVAGMPMGDLQPIAFQVGKTDTLIYKFGTFIELNAPNKKKLAIKSIYYETTSCFGFCPVFKLNIFSDATAYYVRVESPEEPDGNFRATIIKNKLDEILELISYINVSQLKDTYSVDATDNPTCHLAIFFSDGSVKKISDYGLQGTLGLKRLYDLLFALRSNHQWK